MSIASTRPASLSSVASLADEPCQVCGGRKRKSLFEKFGFEIVRCPDCTHVYVPFKGSPTDLARWYDAHFFHSGAYSNYEADKHVLQRNFTHFIQRLRRWTAGGRLFEVGAAYGYFLELAQRHWAVSGIDIQSAAVSNAQRLGLDVQCGEFLDVDVAEEAFDAVVLWDTIEHLGLPAQYVERAARMLKPGGVLALTTGDVESRVARWRGKRWRLFYPPLHLHYFSRRTLDRLFARYGLETVETEYVGFYRSFDTMLYRVLVDRQPRMLHPLYRAATRLRLTRPMMYLDIKDIFFVVARKPHQGHGLHTEPLLK